MIIALDEAKKRLLDMEETLQELGNQLRIEEAKEIADIGFDGIAISIRYVWPDEGKERKLGDPLHGRTGEVSPISIRKADFSNSRNTIASSSPKSVFS